MLKSHPVPSDLMGGKERYIPRDHRIKVLKDRAPVPMEASSAESALASTHRNAAIKKWGQKLAQEGFEAKPSGFSSLINEALEAHRLPEKFEGTRVRDYVWSGLVKGAAPALVPLSLKDIPMNKDRETFDIMGAYSARYRVDKTVLSKWLKDCMAVLVHPDQKPTTSEIEPTMHLYRYAEEAIYLKPGKYSPPKSTQPVSEQKKANGFIYFRPKDGILGTFDGLDYLVAGYGPLRLQVISA